jgi:large subunit ribosomal protein L21
MFAVIKTGGKQYKVAANDVLKIEKIMGEEGDIVTFDQVLMVGSGDDVTVGAPLVAGASVAAEFLGNKKNRTVLIVKKHRRQHFDRRNGHRQLLSSVRITEILIGGQRPTIEARAKKAAAPAVTDEAPATKPARARKAKAPAAEAAEAVPVVETAPVVEAPAAEKAAPRKAAARKTAAKKAATPTPATDEAAAPAKAAPKKRATKPKAEKE